MGRELVFSARRQDFQLDTFSAGGPGGQHQNKKQSGVRITHLPTGLAAECREYREQPRNRKEAFRKLASKLVGHIRAQLTEQRDQARSGEVVRTYNEPDNRVKDHASGLQESYREVVVNGNIARQLEARRRVLRDE
jgi:peptide chain release factor 1